MRVTSPGPSPEGAQSSFANLLDLASTASFRMGPWPSLPWGDTLCATICNNVACGANVFVYSLWKTFRFAQETEE